MNRQYQHIEVLAFDADDTLWDCQSHFDQVEKDYCRLLAGYADAAKVSNKLFQTETRNMDELGYGCKAFTLSLIENAIRISNGQLTATETMQIMQMGRSLLRLPATPLKGVKEALQQLKANTALRLVVMTKGELQDQQNKMERSGLKPFFSHFTVVADKTAEAYHTLAQDLAIPTTAMCMVGNSVKSDIIPALEAGCSAIHIPFHVTWKHEEADTATPIRFATINNIEELPPLFMP